jgi:Family of unknown function (DUF6192)
MPDQSYQRAVREAARCLAQGEESDWRLAQLTYERTHRHGRPRNGDERVPMEQWCADIHNQSSVRVRFGPATGFRYARIWARYGENMAQAPLFKDAYAEVDGTPDRARMMAYESRRLLEEGTTEQKAETAAALLDDDEVREQIALPQTEVAQAFNDAVQDNVERRVSGPRQAPSPATAEVVQGLDAGKALLDLEKAMREFVTKVARIFPRVEGLPSQPGDVWAREHYLRQYLARVQGAADQIKALLDTGRPGGDIDDFVKEVLTAGKRKP